MPRHWVFLAVGLLLDLLGTVWLLQGINLLPGSFMTGQPFWAVAGLVAMIAGVSFIILAMRQKAQHG